MDYDQNIMKLGFGATVNLDAGPINSRGASWLVFSLNCLEESVNLVNADQIILDDWALAA